MKKWAKWLKYKLINLGKMTKNEENLT